MCTWEAVAPLWDLFELGSKARCLAQPSELWFPSGMTPPTGQVKGTSDTEGNPWPRPSIFQSSQSFPSWVSLPCCPRLPVTLHLFLGGQMDGLCMDLWGCLRGRACIDQFSLCSQVLAGMNIYPSEFENVKEEYNVRGYPTICYFE